MDIEELFQNLYSAEGNVNEIVAQCYSNDAIFEDPLISCQGQDTIAFGFNSLRYCFSKIEFFAHTVSEDEDEVNLDYTVTYTLKFIPIRIKLRCFSIVVIKPETNRIARHTDHWSLASVLSSVPIVGTLYHRVLHPSSRVLARLLTRAFSPCCQPRRLLPGPRGTLPEPSKGSATKTGCAEEKKSK